MSLKHVLLLDIDGLRADVLASALASGRAPNLESMLGGSGLAARIISDRVDADTDPLGPGNPLVLMTGPSPSCSSLGSNQSYLKKTLAVKICCDESIASISIDDSVNKMIFFIISVNLRINFNTRKLFFNGLKL